MNFQKQKQQNSQNSKTRNDFQTQEIPRIWTIFRKPPKCRTREHVKCGRIPQTPKIELNSFKRDEFLNEESTEFLAMKLLSNPKNPGNSNNLETAHPSKKKNTSKSEICPKCHNPQKPSSVRSQNTNLPTKKPQISDEMTKSIALQTLPNTRNRGDSNNSHTARTQPKKKKNPKSERRKPSKAWRN